MTVQGGRTRALRARFVDRYAPRLTTRVGITPRAIRRRRSTPRSNTSVIPSERRSTAVLAIRRTTSGEKPSRAR